MNYGTMQDALHNASVDCLGDAPKSEDVIYGRGVLVGLVSGIMGMGEKSFADALYLVTTLVQKSAMTTRIYPECVPSCWLKDFRTAGLIA